MHRRVAAPHRVGLGVEDDDGGVATRLGVLHRPHARDTRVVERLDARVNGVARRACELVTRALALCARLARRAFRLDDATQRLSRASRARAVRLGVRAHV